jgi:hypothetical protein
MRCMKNLDAWSGGGWRVVIGLNHHIAVGEAVCRWAHRTVRCATGHCLVRQPRHPTVRVLTVSTVGALTSWGTGQFGAAPDSPVSHRTYTIHCPVRRTVRALFTLQATVALASRCSGGTPDSPVAHRTIRWIIAERLSRNPKVASLKPYGPGHRTLSGAPDQGSL